MVCWLLAAITLATYPPGANCRAQKPARVSMTSRLDDLRRTHRPLLVFASDSTDKKFVEQVKLLADKASELDERQVLFIPIAGQTDAPAHIGKDTSRQPLAQLSAGDAAAARLRYHVAPAEFTLILIGKDGGEKFRSHTPVTIEKLSTIIDAMPMRQQEVRDGHPH